MAAGLSELPLTARTVHLCIDMQRLFGPAGPWSTPWLERVLPVVTELASRFPERTVFTRFVTPNRPEDMPGMWQPYYRKWREVTRDEADPSWLELMPPLAPLAPPAVVIDISSRASPSQQPRQPCPARVHAPTTPAACNAASNLPIPLR
jgi:nicotinamidase-related amidase